MAINESLILRLILKPNDYVSGTRKAAGATDVFRKKAGNLDKGLGNLRRNAGGLGSTLGAGLGLAGVGALMDNAIDAASDLNESVNAVNKTFGDGANIIHGFGKASAEQVGLSNRAFNELAVSVGAILGNVGLDARFVANETINLTRRAADMASVFNTDVSEALGGIQAALRGENEQIRRFGVNLSATEIAQRAVEMGLADSTSEVDKQAKALATLDLIYEQTNKTAGDFADTSGELANKQRILEARSEDLAAQLGQNLIPAKTAALSALNKLAEGTSIIVGFFDEEARAANQVRAAFAGLEPATADVQSQVDGLANSIDFLRDKQELDLGIVEQLAAATGLEAEQRGAAIAAVLEHQRATEGLTAETKVLEDALYLQIQAMGAGEERTAELVTKYGLQDAAARNAAAAVMEVTDATQEQADATEDVNVELKTYIERLQEAANPALAASRAYDRYTDAVGNVKDALAKQQEAEDKLEKILGRKRAKAEDIAAAEAAVQDAADDVARAQRDQAAAALEAQAALDSLTPANVEAAASAIATALGKSKDEAMELLRQLGLLDGKTVTTVVRQRVRGVDSRGRISQVGFRAHGGAVGGGAGRQFVVGERGPELLDMGGAQGNITPISNTSSLELHIHQPTTTNLDRDIRRGLSAAAFLQVAN